MKRVDAGAFAAFLEERAAKKDGCIMGAAGRPAVFPNARLRLWEGFA